MERAKRIIVGISGGSDAVYALALLGDSRSLGIELHLVASRMGAHIMQHERDVSDGIGVGAISYAVLELFCGKGKEVSSALYVLAAICVTSASSPVSSSRAGPERS